MEKETLVKMIEEDTQGLLDIESKANYRIYGRIKGQRGGAFHGFEENGTPVFGGGNLIYCPIWWGATWTEVQAVCDKIIAEYPECEATPDKCN